MPMQSPLSFLHYKDGSHIFQLTHMLVQAVRLLPNFLCSPAKSTSPADAFPALQLRRILGLILLLSFASLNCTELHEGNDVPLKHPKLPSPCFRHSPIETQPMSWRTMYSRRYKSNVCKTGLGRAMPSLRRKVLRLTRIPRVRPMMTWPPIRTRSRNDRARQIAFRHCLYFTWFSIFPILSESGLPC